MSPGNGNANGDGGFSFPKGPAIPKITTGAKRDNKICNDDSGPTVKATTLDELHSLQKKRSAPTTPINQSGAAFSEEERQKIQLQSISASLASLTRESGPKVVRGDPAEKKADGSTTPAYAHGQHPSIFSPALGAVSDSSLKFTHVLYNLSPAELYEQAIKYEKGSFITSNGALATLSGAKTGRAPRDKRVVRDATTEDELWWGKGSPNIEMDEHTFTVNRERAVDYLNSLEKVFVNDQFLNWDPENRIKVRIVSARAYHSLFMHNIVSGQHRRSLRASVLQTSPNTPWTGKTTLSTDHNRYLIGDDEHCWTETGVSNIEGGCYAKCVDLSREKEPDIWNAIKFGTVLENVVFDEHTREVDYSDKSVTENTRAAYPIEFIPNPKMPCVGPHPKNVILLACDAFGVLPPVSKLNLAQTMYHFISGYTALVAGTEDGIKEPTATFSACFGAAAFIMLHPTKYAAMLAEKMKTQGATGWLVNTGWSGGSYGVGNRIKLAYTRKIIDAIHSGSLLNANYKKTDIFGFEIPTEIEGIPSEILDPVNSWSDKKAHKETLLKPGGLFKKNFETFANHKIGVDGKLTEEILAAGPIF
ncbi:phosphoenolpyruvate carboxykinase (ATP) 1-like [Raphanus sativus]|uniref:phosphoenolpyruvate carboxykinase (ATP) n=1 Tax=Raphanus sativus TaxID=3726 RepID=A0A6J0N2X6_RAPSA|nr:phosphoenolpyruvate carboxykinase (ATP) 1-like [Raphanus sativus]